MTSVTVSDTEVSFINSREAIWGRPGVRQDAPLHPHILERKTFSEQKVQHDRVRLRAAASPAPSEPGFCRGLEPFLPYRCYAIVAPAPASRSLLAQSAAPLRTPLDRRALWFPPHRPRRIGGHPAGSPGAPNQAAAEPVRVSATKVGARQPAGREALPERAALPWAASSASGPTLARNARSYPRESRSTAASSGSQSTALTSSIRS